MGGSGRTRRSCDGLELYMSANRIDGNPSAGGIIPGMFDVLIVRGQPQPFAGLNVIIGLENLLGSVGQGAISQVQSSTPGGEIGAMLGGKAVDHPGQSHGVIWAAPAVALEARTPV